MENLPKKPLFNRRVTDPDSIAIDIRLLHLAYRNVPAMIFVNIAAAACATLVLVNGGVQKAPYWFIGVLILSLFRAWTWLSFETAKKGNQIDNNAAYQYLRRLYAAGLYMSACAWLSILSMCIDQSSQDGKYTLSLIISALAGGATGITAPLKNEGRNYIIILLFGSAFLLAISSTENIVLSLLTIVFMAAMAMSHHTNHTVMRKSLTLQKENHQLITDLRDTNNSLERRVSKRTEALKRIAHHDTLTNLSNRRDIFEWMERNLSIDKEGEAAILFLDLDRFKQINDAMGHDIGDQVLQIIAQRFQEALPENAILGRWGGDEFILITAQSLDTRSFAVALAKKLIQIAISPFEIQGEKLGVGLSVGIAYYPTDANNYKDAIQAADLSVAEVKRTGRGNVLTFTDSYANTQRRRFELSRALADAISSNKLQLVYQPIIAATTGEVISLEALTRWVHPTLGNIEPEEFIRLAEDTDRIIALGNWVLRHACAEASHWNCVGTPPKISINVSIKQLVSEFFTAQVSEILSATSLPAHRLQLEVTESLFALNNIDIALHTVTQLHQMGIEIHIDDFGTGYSSLSRLHQFPIDTIKIDRTFIASSHEQARAIIESTIIIAKRMNLKVVAEGIETAEQAELLALLGVDYLQGNYLAAPMPEARLNAVEKIWNKNNS